MAKKEKNDAPEGLDLAVVVEAITPIVAETVTKLVAEQNIDKQIDDAVGVAMSKRNIDSRLDAVERIASQTKTTPEDLATHVTDTETKFSVVVAKIDELMSRPAEPLDTSSSVGELLKNPELLQSPEFQQAVASILPAVMGSATPEASPPPATKKKQTKPTRYEPTCCQACGVPLSFQGTIPVVCECGAENYIYRCASCQQVYYSRKSPDELAGTACPHCKFKITAVA